MRRKRAHFKDRRARVEQPRHALARQHLAPRQVAFPRLLAAARGCLGRRSNASAVGLQLAGPAFSENRILDAAHALEAAIAFDARPARSEGRVQ